MSVRSPAGAAKFPVYRRSEIIVDRWIHGIGLMGGMAAAAFLLALAVERQEMKLLLGVGLYAFGLLAMLGSSALYNLAPPSLRKESLRRFDHAAIFVMIAGSYTPFLLNRIGGDWGSGMLAFVWSVAILGAWVALAAPRRFERAQLAGYLLLGWSMVVAASPLVAHVAPSAILLLILGGLFYSLGVPVHLARRLRFHNALWHGFVLIAAGCHYAAVLIGVMYAS